MSFGGPTRLKLLTTLAASYWIAQGYWGYAAATVFLMYPLCLGMEWLFDVGLPRPGRWVWGSSRVRLAVLLVLVALGLSGCQEAAYRINELHGWNCRPETTRQYGSCMPMRGAEK